jgi:hypothetical protein
LSAPYFSGGNQSHRPSYFLGRLNALYSLTYCLEVSHVISLLLFISDRLAPKLFLGLEEVLFELNDMIGEGLFISITELVAAEQFGFGIFGLGA